MRNILWLCSWYPNKLQPFEGDFIQRHAQATSFYNNVQVIYIVRDPTGEITSDVLTKEYSNGNLNEMVIYYYSRPVTLVFLDKYFSFLKFKRVFKKAISQYVHKKGKPDLIHVHTGMKAGLLAMWVKKKIQVPYVVSEHWTGFLPEAQHRFGDLPVYIRKSWKELIKNAAGVSVVSVYLGNKMQEAIKRKFPVTVIANAVNTSIFFPGQQQKKNLTKFVHVSGLDFQKNPERILEAFSIIKKKGYQFCLDIFGSPRSEVEMMVNELGLSGEVHFHGEVTQPSLSKFFQEAGALILYSRYETFGCVIIEANACGLPVIVSDIPVLREIVKEGENGIFVIENDSRSLAEKLLFFMSGQISFDTRDIASIASAKYNYAEIGKRFDEWYKHILENKIIADILFLFLTCELFRFF